MPGVLQSFRRSRRRLFLVAALLAFTGQAVATLLAPTAEARASQSAPAHIEQGGTHRHHSHNPNDCPACIALQITALPQHAAEQPTYLAVRFAHPRTASRRVVLADRFDPKTPRAPPAVQASAR